MKYWHYSSALTAVGVGAIILSLVFGSCGGGGLGQTPRKSRSRLLSGGEQVLALQNSATLVEILTKLNSFQLPTGVDTETSAQLKSELERQLLSLQSGDPASGGGLKFALNPPSGPQNVITDLTAVDNSDGTFTLSWTYRNVGDYNQDGIVDIADIGPLAENFLQPALPENEWIDGNRDGVINISDLAPLAENIFSEVAGYIVESSDSADGEFTEIARIEFPAEPTGGRRRFETVVHPLQTSYWRVAPYDSEGTAGDPSDVIQIIVTPPQPGNLPPVARFTARPVWGVAPLPVQFDSSPSYDPDGEIGLYEWDFDGDGIYDETSSSAGTTTQVYEVADSYSATLRVTDTEGATSIASKTIVVITSIYYTISGTVRQDNGVGLEGVTVTLLPKGVTTLTDRDGHYEFGGLTSGVYTVEVSRANWSITPQDQTVYVFDEDVQLDDFSAIWAGSGGRGDWYMFGRDRKHSARSPFVGPHTTGNYLNLLVTANTNIAFGEDGSIYFGGGGTEPERRGLLALLPTPPNGSVKWRFTLEESAVTNPIIDENGNVYFGGGDGFFYKLNPDGTMRWRLPILTSTKSHPAIADDGTIYICGAGKLHAVEREGTLKWTYDVGMTIESSPAVGDDGTIYFGSNDFNVYALNPDGTLKWSYDTGAAVSGSPAIDDDGTIYIGSESGVIYAFYPDGNVKWSYQTEGPIRSATPAIAGDGTIYIGAYNYLYALASDGSLKWRFKTDDVITGQPAVGADGTIYFSPEPGILSIHHIYALSPGGEVVFDNQWIAHRRSGAPAIGPDGSLYVVSGDVRLYRDLPF